MQVCNLHGMATTIQVRGVNTELWLKAKAKAIVERLTSKQLIERLLADYLKSR